MSTDYLFKSYLHIQVYATPMSYVKKLKPPPGHYTVLVSYPTRSPELGPMSWDRVLQLDFAGRGVCRSIRMEISTFRDFTGEANGEIRQFERDFANEFGLVFTDYVSRLHPAVAPDLYAAEYRREPDAVRPPEHDQSDPRGPDEGPGGDQTPGADRG